MKKNSTILVFLISLQAVSYCQIADAPKENTSLFATTLQYNALELLPHHDTLKSLKKGFIHNIEVDAIFRTNGAKQWHKGYKYPQVGVSLNYYNLGNKEILGNALGVYPFISIKLAKQNILYANFRCGAGLAYITKIYNSNNNPTNIAISTPLNILIDFRFNIGLNISNKISIQTSVMANHISNGAIKKPNYGLNSAGVGIGLIYRFYDQVEPKPQILTRALSKSNISLSFLGSIKETGNAGGPKYYPLSLQISFIKPVSSLIELGGSIDIMYDKSVRFHLRENGINYSSPGDDFSVGLVAKVKLPMDKLSTFGDFGVYLYQPNPQFPVIYQRIGLSYSLTKKIDVITALKTHFTVADHLDFGITAKL